MIILLQLVNCIFQFLFLGYIDSNFLHNKSIFLLVTASTVVLGLYINAVLYKSNMRMGVLQIAVNYRFLTIFFIAFCGLTTYICGNQEGVLLFVVLSSVCIVLINLYYITLIKKNSILSAQTFQTLLSVIKLFLLVSISNLYVEMDLLLVLNLLNLFVILVLVVSQKKIAITFKNSKIKSNIHGFLTLLLGFLVLNVDKLLGKLIFNDETYYEYMIIGKFAGLFQQSSDLLTRENRMKILSGKILVGKNYNYYFLQISALLLTIIVIYYGSEYFSRLPLIKYLYEDLNLYLYVLMSIYFIINGINGLKFDMHYVMGNIRLLNLISIAQLILIVSIMVTTKDVFYISIIILISVLAAKLYYEKK